MSAEDLRDLAERFVPNLDPELQNRSRLIVELAGHWRVMQEAQAIAQAELADLVPLAISTLEELQESSSPRVAAAAAAELAQARRLGL